MSGPPDNEEEIVDADPRRETANDHEPPSNRGQRRAASKAERYRHTRTSAAWAGVVIAILFGVALVDFIAQNTKGVRIEFFSFSGRIPIAVALLAAALAGAVVVVAVGVSRVLQLRLNLRRQRRRANASNGTALERGDSESPDDNERSHDRK
ncbi:MAG: lipopolysaccharide assembly protein LapA domain-containing protein [Acidimicrobiales bacterium]